MILQAVVSFVHKLTIPYTKIIYQIYQLKEPFKKCNTSKKIIIKE